ncbi:MULTISPECIES: hypothetical protein [Streptomyces]|uniref:hypothetical protein n=1 Tax=Streptomyces TaxID=1883 RepID=UPI0029310E61|nr:hypothetical protein [Streptomyces sp. NEAU-HV9]
MTGNHRNTSLTRRRALAVTGGTVRAGARGILEAGGTATEAGAAALFPDSLPVGPRGRAA